MAKKIEMLNDQQEVVHPLTSSDCVIMENGKTLEEVMGDGIATPTVTHEGASFQVGVGDSNIEVVDGDVAGMTLEGQTYQNILPKPTTLIMETDEKEFKINDKIDNNIVLDDNIAEIATVKGQTYVNVVQEESATEYTVLGEELSGQSITTTGKPEGVIKNATLEGMTLVNTIQEPSEATSVVLDLDADINAQSATIDNTVQGGIHRATLKGQTLVNISTQKSSNTFTFQSAYNGATPNRQVMAVAPANGSTLTKPSTRYIVKFTVSNYINNYGGSVPITILDYDIYSVVKTTQVNGNGDYYIIGVTKETLGHEGRILIKSNATLFENNTETKVSLTISNIMVLEYQDGIENWDIPYFEGMKSVEFPSVKTTGKNLFDGILTQGYIGDNSGVANTSSSGVHSPNYMKVKPNTTYTRAIFGNYPSKIAGRVYFYDINKTYLCTYKDGATFVTPENAHYIRFRYFVSSGSITPDDFSGSNIQIEEGSTATTYEPYQSSNTKVGLLPILETEQGCYYSASTGARLTSNPNVNSVKYEVQGLSKVYVKVAHSNFSFWDSNDTYISGQPTITGGNNNEGYLGIPTNAVYMRCAVDNTKIAEVYEPVTLRKVGDVQDELDLETGKLTQRIGEVSLVNKTWIKNESFANPVFGVSLSNAMGDGMSICDKFKRIPYEERFNIKVGEYYITKTNSDLYIGYNNVTTNEFKTYIDGISPVVQYVLATPIVKTVSTTVLDQDNNSLKTIQAQPTLTHITTSSNGLIPFVSIPSQLKYPTIIKPSTQYTLKLKRDVVDSANQLTVNVGGVSTSVTSDIMTITTPDALTSQDIVFTGKNNVVSQLQLIEGDVTGIDYPFFEGMLDVRPRINMSDVVDNLLDLSNLVANNTNGANYIIDGNVVCNTTGKDGLAWDSSTPVYRGLKPSTKYILYIKNLGTNPVTVSRGYTRTGLGQSTAYMVQNLASKAKTYFTLTTEPTCSGNLTLKVIGNNLPVKAEIYFTEYRVGMEKLISHNYFTDENTQLMMATGKNILKPSILNSIITNSTKGYAGIDFTYNSDGSFTMTGTFTSNVTLHGDSKEFIKLLKHGSRYRTSDMMLLEVTSLNGSMRWTNDFTFDRNNHIKVTPYYQWNGVTGNTINKTYYPQIEEGATATSYEPYKGVTIEQSIDSIPLTSDMFEQGYYDYNNIIKGMSLQQLIKQNSNIRLRSKSLISVKPNTTYQLSDTSIYIWALPFDKNGGLLGGKIGTVNDTLISNFTTDANTHYIAPVIFITNSDSSLGCPDLSSLNLTLQEVADEIVLRSIGDVKDTLNLTTGEYVQRIGEVVLDGSEDWAVHNSTFTNVIRFRCTTPITNQINTFDDMMICDRFASKDLGRDNRGIQVYNSMLLISINKNEISSEDANGFKQWLQNNPTKAQYPLATPIITKVNLTNTIKLPSYNSTTHYDTIVPSNSLIPNIKLPSTIDYNVAIKPSTQYTVRCNTTNALSVNLGGSTGTLANGKVTLTTPSTLAHNSLKLGNGKVKEVMVIEGSEIKDNVPFFNGMKNVQMGGIKLVNIARGISVGTNGKVTANTNKTQFTYTGDGMNWGYVNFDASLLKPNTVYTLYVNIITNNGTDSSGSIKYEVGTHLGQFSHNISSDYTGIYKKVITSVSEQDIVAGHLKLAFRPTTSGNQIVIKNPMVIEGDWTHLDEIPYIESEMIIEQPIIKSQGKNLFNPFSLKVQLDNSNSTVSLISTAEYKITSLSGATNMRFGHYMSIKMKKGETLTFSGSCKNIINARIFKNNNFLEYSENGMVGYTFSNQTEYEEFSISRTATEDCVFNCRFWINSDKSNDGYIKNIQVEKSSSKTTYEPFKQHTLSSNRVIGYEEGVHYGGITGIKSFNADFNSVMADVEGLSIAYVTNGSSNFSFWDKDMVFISGKSYLDTSLSSDNKNGFIQVPSNAKYMKFASSIFASTATYYAKATVTGELPLRSLPNGVCDSFNLVTGEYVQRVGEVVLDGSHPCKNDTTNGTLIRFNIFGINSMIKVRSSLKCDKLPVLTDTANNQECIHNGGSDNYKLMLWIDSSHLSTQDASGLNKYLSQNPITVQYELETPIVRKIGLTAKGNYKEIELNGSERMAQNPNLNKKFHIYDLNLANDGQLYTLFTNKEQFTIVNSAVNYTMYKYRNGSELVMTIDENINTVDLFKRWLSQNPIKVGHLTNDSASLYSNIQKPIFFNDVKVQFMNDNVDIQPTLTLQARSRNSYVMDMMKANTTYTLKALRNPNSFTIDGTLYNATTNGTFTSPSTLTNKLLITGQDAQELMIIEGDVTGKQLPYYKGIRSSFDNTDEIEIYSANKNLLPKEFNNRCFGENIKQIARVCSKMIECKPNATYTVYNIPSDINTDVYVEYTNDYAEFGETVTTSRTTIGSQGKRSKITFTTPIGYKYMAIYIYSGSGFSEDGYNYTNVEIGLCLGTLDDYTYQPHKENSTIINMPTRWETVEVVKVDRVKDMEIGAINHSTGANTDSSTVIRTKNYIPVQPNMQITYCNNGVERATHFIYYDINKNFIGGRIYESGVTSKGTVTTPDNCYFIRLYHGVTNVDNLTITKKQYKPIALNELPNGVKDELIINRATSSAKLIRRVGKVVLDGGVDEEWLDGGWNFNDVVEMELRLYDAIGYTKGNMFCDKIKTLDFNSMWQNGSVNAKREESITIFPTNKRLIVLFDINKISSNNIEDKKQYLKQNPITVYYELAEPVVTEIQLKGYPFVYKDGSVQLNTEIPHTTKVKYNVNQEHLINGQNETIIRHDKQIDNLYDYIELYLEEEYRMELFRMQLELSL